MNLGTGEGVEKEKMSNISAVSVVVGVLEMDSDTPNAG